MSQTDVLNGGTDDEVLVLQQKRWKCCSTDTIRTFNQSVNKVGFTTDPVFEGLRPGHSQKRLVLSFFSTFTS